jgi:hypothetical protein
MGTLIPWPFFSTACFVAYVICAQLMTTFEIFFLEQSGGRHIWQAGIVGCGMHWVQTTWGILFNSFIFGLKDCLLKVLQV